MILKTKIYVSLIACVMFSACHSTSDNYDLNEQQMDPEKSRKKNGLVTVFDDKGGVKSNINFKQGKKHGKAITYYNNGKPLLETNYVDGLREGMSIKYFEHGGIYATTPYQNDKINGTRTLYFNTGEKKAEIPYKNNFPGLGLKEFFKNGDIINLDYSLSVLLTNENILKIEADQRCKKAVFYIGSLVYVNYLDPGSAQVSILSQQNHLTGFKALNIDQWHFYRDKQVICECTTKQGNPLILVAGTLENLIPINK